MKLMVSGYGETKQQFGTMRCRATVDSHSVSIVDRAAAYPDGSAEPGVCIRGETRKVGVYSDDNPVNIILHGMSASEALVLADKLVEYAFKHSAREGTVELQKARQASLLSLIDGLWKWWAEPGVASRLMGQASQVLSLKMLSLKDPALAGRKEAFHASRDLLERARQYASDPGSHEEAKGARPVLAFVRDVEEPKD